MKVISSKDETVRLFKSNFCEFFTRVHWSVPLFLYLPLVAYFLFLTWQETSITLPAKGLLLLAGLFAWTLLEYVMHRFVFHFPAKAKFSKKISYLFHGIHHAYPSDSLRLVMPPAVSIPLAIFFYFSLSSTLPAFAFPPVFAALVIGYLCYDMIHYASHHLPMKSPWANYLKRYHLSHHFKEPHRAYGVSSPLWDFVFRTRLSSKSSEKIKKTFSFSFASWLMLGFIALFLSSKYLLGGLERPHIYFALAIFFAFYLSRLTRRFLMIAIPIILYATLYDFLRYIPFSFLQPIHVSGPYHWDQWLFGVYEAGNLLSLNQWLYQVLRSDFADLFSGAIYFLHIPVVLMMVFLLWKKRSHLEAQSYSMAFLCINLLAFATYIFFPVAPPWYVEKFGLVQPMAPVLGDAAGLIAFDQLLGINIYTDSYRLGAVTFGAIPSMHAGFASLVCLYSFKLGKKWALTFGAYILAMYFSALYSQHHYLIDVLVGILYAVLAWWIVDKVLKKTLTPLYHLLWKQSEEKKPAQIIEEPRG